MPVVCHTTENEQPLALPRDRCWRGHQPRCPQTCRFDKGTGALQRIEVHLKRPVNPDGSVMINSKRGLPSRQHLRLLSAWPPPSLCHPSQLLFPSSLLLSQGGQLSLSLTSPRCPCFFSRLSLFVCFRRSLKITTCSFLREHTSVTINSTPKCQLCSSKLVVKVDPQLCQSTLTDKVEKLRNWFWHQLCSDKDGNFFKTELGGQFW